MLIRKRVTIMIHFLRRLDVLLSNLMNRLRPSFDLVSRIDRLTFAYIQLTSSDSREVWTAMQHVLG